MGEKKWGKRRKKVDIVESTTENSWLSWFGTQNS